MTEFPSNTFASGEAVKSRTAAVTGVGQERVSSIDPTHLEPDELEHRIRECGVRMERAYADWIAEGCFAARGEAGFWRIEMERAIKARSPETVARLEAERGLAR